MAQVAAKLGTPLMPWQRLVADTALEVDPETGRLRYRQVVLTVPRQSGKTTLMLALMAHRALSFGGRQRIVYTAQTRNDAREKWEDEHVVTLEGSSLRKQFRVRKTNGNEAILWRNGSTHKIASTTEKSGHGKTLDLGVVDEAFAQTDDRLEQAMRPPMLTRPEPQLWVLSTAGTEASVYLNSKVDAGRQRTLVGDGDSRNAFFEWSAEEGSDPADPETWLSCIPSIGHTVTLDTIAAEWEAMSSEGKVDEFTRAYLNLRTGKHTEPAEIAPEAWLALRDPDTTPVGRVVLSVEVSMNREWATITATGRNAAGKVHGEIVDRRRGTSWVLDELPGIVDRSQPLGTVIDPGGPAGSLVAPLEAAGVELMKTTTRDVGQAFNGFLDLVSERVNRTDDNPEGDTVFAHNGDPILAEAVAIGQARPMGDQRAWRRRDAIGDVSPLVALTNGCWAFNVLADDSYDVLASVP